MLEETSIDPQIDPLKPILDEVVAFVNAPDWKAGKKIVREKENVLLSPQTAAAFELLQAQYHDQPNEIEMLHQHQSILRLCREVGIDEAFRRVEIAANVPQEIVSAVLEFLNAPGWAESRGILEEHRDLLLTDEADTVFEGLLAKYTGQETETYDLQQHRDILRRARETDIDSAFDDLRVTLAREVIDAVLAFVNATTLEEKRQVIRQKGTLLYSDEADSVFEDLMSRYEGQPQQRSIIMNNRELVRRSRVEGLDRAFVDAEAESMVHVSQMVVDSVREYLAADTWEEAEIIVEHRRDHLLGEPAQVAMRLIKAQVQDRPEVASAIEQRQQILRRAAEIGIPAAFAEVK